MANNDVFIDFKANMDLFNKELNTAVGNLQKLQTNADGINKADGFDKAAGDVRKLNTQLGKTEGQIEDVERSIREWQAASKKATNTKDLGRYNRNIEEAQRELKRLKTVGTSSLKKLQTETTKASDKMGGFGKMLKRAFGAAAIIMATRALIRFGRESVMLYDEQKKKEAQLLTALDGRKMMTQRLIKQAKELQSVTRFGDEEIIDAQSQLAKLLGNDEAAIKRLTPLVLDFATIQGVDLKTAADLVAKSVASGTNALSRYGIVIEGAVGSNERLDSAVNALTDSMGGQAEAAALAGAGSFEQLGNVINDTKEHIGGFIARVLDLSGVTKKLIEINEAVDFEVWFNGLEASEKALYSLTEAEYAQIEAQSESIYEIAATIQSHIEYRKAINDSIASLTELGYTQAEVTRMGWEMMDIWQNSNKTLEEKKKAVDDIIDKYQEMIKAKKGLDEIDPPKGPPGPKEKTYEIELFNYKKYIEQLAAEDEKLLTILGLSEEEKVRKRQESLDLMAVLDEEYYKEATQKIENFNKVQNGYYVKQVMDMEWAVKDKIRVLKAEYEQGLITEEDYNKAIEELQQGRIDKLGEYLKQGVDIYSKYADAAIKANDDIIKSNEKRIDSLKDDLQTEIELKKLGLRNNIAGVQAEIEATQRAQQQALKKKEQLAKQEKIINNISTASNLVAANAEMIKTATGFGPLAPIIAVGLIAAVMTIFQNAASKAGSLQFAKGDGAIMGGRSHAEGGNPILWNGQVATAERGEFQGIASRMNTAKYGDGLITLFKGMRKNDDPLMISGITDLLDNIDTTTVFNAPKGEYRRGDLKNIERALSNRQSEGNGYKEVKFGNTTRRIRHV